jgi:hypothetical protein
MSDPVLPSKAAKFGRRTAEAPAPIHQRLLLIGLATLVQWQFGFERLRLQVAGGESPRS